MIMKQKHFLIFSFLFICSYSSFAQWGVRLGINRFATSVDGNLNSFSGIGLNAGITYDIGEHFILQPGVYFSQKGPSAFYYDDNSIEWDETPRQIQLNYLEIPVNILYKLTFNHWKIYAGIGAVCSFGMGGQYITQTFGEENSSPVKFKKGNEPDVFYIENPFDFGIQPVIGVEYQNFSLNLNYNIGLTELQYDKGVLEDASVKNRTIGITLGWRWDFKDK